MKNAMILIAAAALCACAARPVAIAPSCPPVPECRAEIAEIRTHAELAQGFVTYRTAFEQCRLYRDTLAACVSEGGK